VCRITLSYMTSSILELVQKYSVYILHGGKWSYRRKRGLWPRSKIITVKVEGGRLCYYKGRRRTSLNAETLTRDYEPLDSARYTGLVQLQAALDQKLLP
jgi:hypothetical protein